MFVLSEIFGGNAFLIIVVSVLLFAFAIYGTITINEMLLRSIVTKKGRIIYLIVLSVVFMLILLSYIFIPSLAVVIIDILLISLAILGIIKVLVMALFVATCYFIIHCFDE